MKLNKTLLAWYVPFSVHRAKAIGEIREAFPPVSFVRIIIVYTAIFVAIRTILLRRFPLIEVDWLSLYFISIASILAFVIPAALAALVPPRIALTERGVLVQQGNRPVFYPFAGIASIRIDENPKPFSLLRISFLEQQPEKEFPIATKISIQLLQEIITQRRLGR
jgi:branched-subunit amino acid transport protein